MMKAIHTLWTGGQDEKFRFGSVQGMKDAMHLSALLAKRNFGRIALYTDEKGSALVSDFRYIYDECHIVLDQLEVHPDAWSFTKIWVYAQQTEPFCHIDNDVFLWDRLPQVLLEADCFFQGRELLDWHTFYYDFHAEFLEEFTPIMSSLPAYAPNCGIFGCNNIEWLHSYYEAAFYFHFSVQFHVLKDEFQRHHICLFEQLLLTQFLGNMRIEFLLNDDASEKYECRYTHMIADAKRNPHLLAQVQKKLAAMLENRP